MSCKNKVTVKKSNRYCGEDLDCIGVKKGDTYDSALANINEVVCNGGSATTYEFEDNEECDANGFLVYEIRGEERNLIYKWCQDCCTSGYWYFTGRLGECELEADSEWHSYINCGSISGDPFIAPKDGTYKITMESSIIGYSSGGTLDEFGITLGIGVNGQDPVNDSGLTPDSVKFPANNHNFRFTISLFVDLLENDVIDIHYRIGSSSTLTNSNRYSLLKYYVEQA